MASALGEDRLLSSEPAPSKGNAPVFDTPRPVKVSTEAATPFVQSVLPTLTADRHDMRSAPRL